MLGMLALGSGQDRRREDDGRGKRRGGAGIQPRKALDRHRSTHSLLTGPWKADHAKFPSAPEGKAQERTVRPIERPPLSDLIPGSGGDPGAEAPAPEGTGSKKLSAD
ncbi:hypothetical protein GCM10011317_16140 [Niveispirillum cyanobacteriorum]|nr:hypothetical protein GCM10011317_16140 [Niveispirillum cyanobacteriorum]